MSLESLIIVIAMLVAVALWIAAPIFGRRRTVDDDPAVALMQNYDRVLTAIHDLDEDIATGKIDRAAYDVERESLVRRGIALLQQLDAVDSEAEAGPTEDAVADAPVDEVEQAVAAYRQQLRTKRVL
jgi:hypothetical protein